MQTIEMLYSNILKSDRDVNANLNNLFFSV